MDLVEFLRARLDEDEQIARDADVGCDLFDGTGIIVMHLHGGGTRSVTLTSNVAHFAARHDPARVLADVAAKRRIVELHAPERVWTGSGYEDGKCTTCLISQSDLYGSEYETAPCPTLRALFLPYANHPDYDESWRP